MAYVDYDFYKSIYGDTMPEPDFDRLEFEARGTVDCHTHRRLHFAFPTDEYAIEAVRRCMCTIINTAWQIEVVQRRVSDAQGYEVNQDGSLRGKIVSSVSSGSESVSYTAKTEQKTYIDELASDIAARSKFYHDIIKACLSMVPDSNGVNLLYFGLPYPFPNAPVSKPPELSKPNPPSGDPSQTGETTA